MPLPAPETVLLTARAVALFDERGRLAGTYRNRAALKLNGYGGFSLDYLLEKGYTVGRVKMLTIAEGE